MSQQARRLDQPALAAFLDAVAAKLQPLRALKELRFMVSGLQYAESGHVVDPDVRLFASFSERLNEIVVRDERLRDLCFLFAQKLQNGVASVKSLHVNVTASIPRLSCFSSLTGLKLSLSRVAASFVAAVSGSLSHMKSIRKADVSYCLE